MKKYLILLLIIIFASILRFYGNNYDLPYVFNPEEPYIMDKAVEVADGKLDHGIILRGSLPYYVTGLTIKLATIFYPSFLQGQQFITQAYKINKTPFYIIGRSICVLYSLIEIIVIFHIGKLLFTPSIGLIAAFLTSISILSINFSHKITPDTALSATILFSIYLILSAYKRNSYRLFLISAFFVGFSMAQKIVGIFVFPVLLVSLLASKIFKNINKKRKIAMLIGITLIPFITFFHSYPFLFLDVDKLIKEWSWENETIAWGELVIRDIGLFGRINKYLIKSINFGTGSFILILSSIGILISLHIKKIEAIFLILFTLIFLIGISIPIPNYDDWVLPLVSFVSLFTSVSIKKSIKISQKVSKKIKAFILFSLLLFVIIPPLMKSIFTTILYKSSDTRTMENEWLERNNIKEEKILRDLYTSKYIPEKMLTKVGFSNLSNYDYYIASDYFFSRFFIQENILPEKANMYRIVFNNYLKIKEFRPAIVNTYRNDLEFLLSVNKWFTHQIKGPIISIYKIKK